VQYLVDTDWVIHYLNGHAEIVDRIQQFSGEGLGLSFISLAELYEGVLYSRDPGQGEDALQAFLRGVDLIGLDDETTRIFAKDSCQNGVSSDASVCGATVPLVRLPSNRSC
jgi:predicted nucleic acid-binding protein